MSTLSYTRVGAGEPVVLVHGIGHHGRAWAPVVDLLAEHHDVIAVDLAGHGASPRPAKPHGYSISSHAEQLEGLFDHLGLGTPHVVGNSLGGRIALELGARGSVSSVTALAPAGFYTPPEVLLAGLNLFALKGAAHLPAPVLRAAAHFGPLRRVAMGNLYVNAHRLTKDDFVTDALNLRSSAFVPQAVHAALLREPVNAPVVPTTVVWGKRDLILLPVQAGRAQARLTDAEHVSLPGCGHVPMLDAPETIRDLVVATAARAGQQAVQVAVA